VLITGSILEQVVPAGLFNVGLFGGFKVVDEEVAKSFIVSGEAQHQHRRGKIKYVLHIITC
jgi:hypothetical protein